MLPGWPRRRPRSLNPRRRAKQEASMAAATEKVHETVKVEREGDGITWVILNRPEKRNAMNPTMHFEMLDILTELEVDPQTRVLILTGAGVSWCAGQDLRKYFRGLENKPAERARAGRAAQEWRWHRLLYFPKPTY